MPRLLLSFLLLALLAIPAEAARIVVTIDGMHSAKGNLVVALYSRPDGFPDGDYSDRHTQVKASLEPVTIVFDGLKPGTYAVGAYHDENANGRFDTNFIGYPAEGYALSNGIRAVISRPRFVDAAFAVSEGEKRVSLHIKY
jgi:uncharacterized protein (DUF2141 family)